MMLESVISAVVDALDGSGLGAERAYRRQRLCRREGTLICVSVLKAKGLPAGLGAYLGTAVDPGTGRSEELYGARCEMEIGLDIYAAADAENGAAECMRCADLIAPALGALPEGIKLSALSFDQAVPDAETGRFVCHGIMTASAYFIARSREDEGGFTDFILRGTVER